MSSAIAINIGQDNFRKMIKSGGYYIDKTSFISELARSMGHVNLITRPRRFGKTLNLSMLESFFEIGADASLFEGLAVKGDREAWNAHFGRYPVIRISFKDIAANTFDMALRELKIKLQDFCENHRYLLESNKVSSGRKESIEYFLSRLPENVNPNEPELKNALKIIANSMFSHFEKEVVILIDEYDSIANQAAGKGYQKELLSFLSGFFGAVFKDNSDVEFIVAAGCLRIAKESIFTGANNLVVSTISDVDYSTCFGLTECEVAKVLSDLKLEDATDIVRDWYNGYLFGKQRIYNTSDVMSYCRDLLKSPGAEPKMYWSNTSGNDILRDIIESSGGRYAMLNMQRLASGESVRLAFRSEITYDDFSSADSLWSVLAHSGYLTPSSFGSNNFRAPNREVQELLSSKILEWIREETPVDAPEAIAASLWSEDVAGFQEEINKVLMQSMSFFDKLENSYHMLLLGLLASSGAVSNRESGEGRPDLEIADSDLKRAAEIEVKKSYEKIFMLSDALKGCWQILRKSYGKAYENKGFKVLRYSISFFGKSCRVVLENGIKAESIQSAICDVNASIEAIEAEISSRANSEQMASKAEVVYQKGLLSEEDFSSLKLKLAAANSRELKKVLEASAETLSDLRKLQKCLFQ
ncbi:MAG: ATP-binding protein [Clostridiales bacterium]|jgi:hypothetical protein|nr:ATP-binding protein [Clostridiales bacterium]